MSQFPHAARPKAERKPLPHVRRDEARIQKKLAAQSRYPIGHEFRYRGPNPRIAGLTVTVVGHQSRGDIYVTHRCSPDTRVVSPFTLYPIAEVR